MHSYLSTLCLIYFSKIGRVEQTNDNSNCQPSWSAGLLMTEMAMLQKAEQVKSFNWET